jgi:hypothetical protein
LGPNTKASRTHALSLVGQNCPSYLRPCQLFYKSFTFCQHFENIIDELKTEDDVIADDKVDPHAVKGVLFDLEPPNLFGIVILELKLDVPIRSSLAHEFNPNDLDLGRLVFLECLLVDCSQKTLFVFLQRLIIFVLY